MVTVLAVVFAAVALVTAGLTLRSLSSTRDQLTQTQHQLTQTRAQVSTVQQQAQGEHRDLITCDDFNGFLNGYTGPNAGGYIGLNQYLTANNAGYTVPLPPHCLNR